MCANKPKKVFYFMEKVNYLYSLKSMTLEENLRNILYLLIPGKAQLGVFIRNLSSKVKKLG